MALAQHFIANNGFNPTNIPLAANTFASDEASLNYEAFPGELAALRAQASKTKASQAIFSSSQLNVSNQVQMADQLIEMMPTGLVMLDGNGVVVKINKVARGLLDEPILGQPWFNVIARSFKPRADDWHEVSLKDGRRVKLEIASLGSQPGQLIMITDLTETRLLQDKVGQMQRLSSLGRMVSTLAHQIRTPLSAAMLYSANLSNKKLTDTARIRFQEKLSSRLTDLEQQVNDMLLFSKSGTEQVVSSLLVSELIEDSVQTMDALINKANGQVEIQFSDKNSQILANKSALTGAIQNLLHNALQAASANKSNISGGIASSTISNEKQVKINIQTYLKDDHVYISVKDNGPGINTDLVDKIFQPFYTSSSNGTGLGLAVVKSVVNAHQGEVSYLSHQGEGAHFCLKLPLLAPTQVKAQVNTQVKTSTNTDTLQEKQNVPS